MVNYYDEIEIEDFEYSEEEGLYYYPCPCGDNFQITKEELIAGDEVATCPSCSLIIKVIYNREDFKKELAKSTQRDARFSRRFRKLALN